MARRYIMRVKSIVRLIAWNAGLFLVIIAVLEAIFGAWISGDPLSNLNVIRNVEWRYSVDHLYERSEQAVYRRDRWGFRGSFDEPSDVNVLAIGGSTTDQRFITEDETWAAVLAACLTANGEPARVANAGVTGQSSYGHALNFELWFSQIPDLKPRFVLGYIGINELFANSETAAIRNDVRLYNEAANPSSRWSIGFHHVKMKSAFYRVYKLAAGQWTAFKAGVSYGFFGNDEPELRATENFTRTFQKEELRIDSEAYAKLTRGVQKAYGKRLKKYRENLGYLAERIEGIGATPIFVTQRWASYRKNGMVIRGRASDHALQEAFNQVSRDVCRTRNLPCIDLAREVEFLPGETYDPVHTTPAGSRKVGKYLCARMIPIMKRPKPAASLRSIP